MSIDVSYNRLSTCICHKERMGIFLLQPTTCKNKHDIVLKHDADLKFRPVFAPVGSNTGRSPGYSKIIRAWPAWLHTIALCFMCFTCSLASPFQVPRHCIMALLWRTARRSAETDLFPAWKTVKGTRIMAKVSTSHPTKITPLALPSELPELPNRVLIFAWSHSTFGNRLMRYLLFHRLTPPILMPELTLPNPAAARNTSSNSRGLRSWQQESRFLSPKSITRADRWHSQRMVPWRSTHSCFTTGMGVHMSGVQVLGWAKVRNASWTRQWRDIGRPWICFVIRHFICSMQSQAPLGHPWVVTRWTLIVQLMSWKVQSSMCLPVWVL